MENPVAQQLEHEAKEAFKEKKGRGTHPLPNNIVKKMTEFLIMYGSDYQVSSFLQ